jgi:uncharacterized protein YutE (UPF0331/DUF86 family)
MKGYRPDAIARKQGRNIAIEIKHSGSPGTKIRKLQKLFAEHPDWELTVLYLTPRAKATTPGVASNKVIEQSMEQIEELKKTGHRGAALLLGWSVLEAIARAMLPEQLDRPQPPANLVETLAGEGLLTPSEANVLRKIASARNAIAHGELDTNPAPKRVDELIAVLHTLSGLSTKDGAE